MGGIRGESSLTGDILARSFEKIIESHDESGHLIRYYLLVDW